MCSRSRSTRYNTEQNDMGICSVEGWVDFRAGLDMVTEISVYYYANKMGLCCKTKIVMISWVDGYVIVFPRMIFLGKIV
jgi:hypothetical protein